MTKSVFVPKGIDVPALDCVKLWEFKPSNKIKPGAMITGGDILGNVFENNLLHDHRIMLPPKAKGRVISVVEAGNYNIKEPLVEVEFDG
jgi:vacuolar-type H+-ATPase catalytic subunit A/Vma1